MATSNTIQLQIVDSKHGAELSKSQKRFNRLTKQLENLNSNMQQERTKLDDFVKLYSKNIPAYQERLGQMQITAAKMLSEAVDKYKFTNSQIDAIAGVIEMMFDQAFTYVEPDEETKAVYNMWSEEEYDDCVEAQSEDMKSMLEDMLREQMGVDMDFSDLDLNSPEAFHQFQEMLKAKMEAQEGQEQKKVGERKKTKKQREQEAKQDAEEKAQLKSLKGIYYSLAKVLHPDTATDPEETIRKDELMKRVTVAYSKKDLSTLLQLEMEWLQVESDHISKLSDEKLDLYNGVLKEQIENLKMELDMLPAHPCYHCIHPFIHDTPKQGKAAIKAMTEELKFHKLKYEAICREITTKNSILMLIKALTPEVEGRKLDKMFSSKMMNDPYGFDYFD